ncbi:hypothetical protein HWV62_15519 [Athelia sp. TMB]|nr:hypothetical protein HWV62_20774 [Athelia sp. TMB]KAF7973352.1 hypothetical protein HWV62_15519 [Athelia sp. TMB]
MGYTHYWFKLGRHNPQQWEEIFPRLSKDAALLIAASGVAIAGSAGEGEPYLNEDTIALNGSENHGGSHESFILRRGGVGSRGGFCKTAEKPYDVVVTAILIRAAQLLGEQYMAEGGKGEISSDGNWGQWNSGRQLVDKVFPGEEIFCPWGEGTD